jgi:MFS family permease
MLSDRTVLAIAAFVRATTTAFLGVLIGLHLANIGCSPAAIGAIVSAGFIGCAVSATAATFAGDRIGRRRLLVGLAVLGAIGTAVVAFTRHPIAIGIGAFVGMVNGMGRDRGGALVLEQAALPSTTDDRGRTRAIAIYTMLQDIGHALGSLLAGIPAMTSGDRLAGDRAGMLTCAVFGLAVAVLYGKLGSAIDGGHAARSVSVRSRSILVKISSLFAIDSLAGGFLTTALLSYFFFERFHASGAVIAVLFFGARAMNAVSHLGAAWLARRIGLVRTMVFTHIPSSLLLVTVAYAPSFPVAAVLFLLREGLVEMDVPTRQSYVLAVVRPEERTFASGITNLVRLFAWAVAPSFAGALMTGRTMVLPLVIGAAMKITYDLLLWFEFRNARPPEENTGRHG